MSLSGLAPFDRRGHQRRLLVDALRRAQRASRAELAAVTGLSAQTVTVLVEDLVADGLVMELGRRQAARGQPPIELGLNPEGGFAIGLQIDQGRVTGLVADIETRIRSQDQVLCCTREPASALADIGTFVDRLVAAAGVEFARIWGIGIVLPGPFGLEADRDDPLTMPAWTQRDFVPDYMAALRCPVIVGNDATAAAIGEHLDGVARDLRGFVYLYIGEGIGGGLFIDDHPFTGTFGNAGEIGRMLVIDPDRGAPAALESIASVSALRGMLLDAGCDAALSAEADALLDLDPATLDRWFERVADALRIAIVNLENLFDPEAIVLGGPLPTRALMRLAKALEPLPASVSLRRERAQPRLLIARSGRSSSALGGATLALFRALSPQPRAARIARHRTPLDSRARPRELRQ
ncbi:ROK family transcriptional regulator [Salinarimonas soli]|nr:ROK family transcriptional regulator [Salinarimonas soli]